MRFEIAKSRSKKEPFYWRLVAHNGQTLATSEMYTRKASCRKAIASVRKNMDAATVIDTTVEQALMLVEDVATGERFVFACDWPIRVGQHVVVDGRRWVVVDGNKRWKRGEVPPEYR